MLKNPAQIPWTPLLPRGRAQAGGPAHRPGGDEEFHPEVYQDSQRKRMRELIDRKIQGEEIAVTPEEAPKGEIIDLMAALKASLKPDSKPHVGVATMAEEQPVSIANRRPPKRVALTPTPATGKSKPKKRA